MGQIKSIIMALFLLANTILDGNLSMINTMAIQRVEHDREAEFSNSVLAQNIMNNVEQWEFVSDDFTRMYTYDDVAASGVSLYINKGEQGVYYFEVHYSVKTGTYTSSHFKMYIVSETQFAETYHPFYKYDYQGGVITTNAQWYKELSVKAFRQYNDKADAINELVTEALKEEAKYLEEINLNTTEEIVLSDVENQLFNNMQSAISKLEKYDVEDKGIIIAPLDRIKYYDFGDGSCEALFYYQPEGFYSFWMLGYDIDSGGYREMSTSEENRLENTSNLKYLDWNVEWTDEKKEYMLKKAISKK